MKHIVTILLGLLTSLYFYDVSFSFLPEWLTSKNILAVAGAIIFGYHSVKCNSFKLDQDILLTGCLAGVFSMSCLLSVMANGTGDMSYVTYILSFAIWTFGAHGLCTLLRLHHGRLNLKLITDYLMWVSVFQCVIAQVIDNNPAVQMFVDSICLGNNQYMHEMDRLYGFGAALDPAGVRFSIVELLIAHQLIKGAGKLKTLDIWLYYISFFTILVLGCMISRTTTLGAVLAIAYALMNKLFHLGSALNLNRLKSVGILIVILGIAIPIIVHLYNTDSNAHHQLRFAFEGFFNWVETGVWRTDSTDKLNSTMWIWPTDSTGWFIGYGWFGNWVYSTDIGYCRFTLYCGLLGLSIFTYYFMFLAQRFAKRNPGTGMLAFMLFMLTLGVWVKVATDIYLIYAIFMSMRYVNSIYDGMSRQKR